MYILSKFVNYTRPFMVQRYLIQIWATPLEPPANSLTAIIFSLSILENWYSTLLNRLLS